MTADCEIRARKVLSQIAPDYHLDFCYFLSSLINTALNYCRLEISHQNILFPQKMYD